MKFTIELEDTYPLYEIMDNMFLGMLVRELKTTQEFLNDKSQHPDDIKTWNESIKALKVLIEYYGGNDAINNN
jgi:hypothetical protein